jgi:hypothetical protein
MSAVTEDKAERDRGAPLRQGEKAGAPGRDASVAPSSDGNAQ